jgi:hypothetical protein
VLRLRVSAIVLQALKFFDLRLGFRAGIARRGRQELD